MSEDVIVRISVSAEKQYQVVEFLSRRAVKNWRLFGNGLAGRAGRKVWEE